MTLVSTISSIQTKADSKPTANTAETYLVNSNESSKKSARKNGVPLQQLFEQALAENGEQTPQFKWVGDNEIQVDGLSGVTLNNFLLKAEELGKKVTYRRSIVFQIEENT